MGSTREYVFNLDTNTIQEHYEKAVIQPIDYILANGLNFCEGNVIKYVTRHKYKNGPEDILKAIDYLQILLRDEYGIQNSSEL